jgi:tyrosine-protein kinase Etk/Wzc
MPSKINQNTFTDFEQENSNELNIREQIEAYLVHWKWFVLSVIVLVLGAFLYLRYSSNVYKATSIVMLKDDRKGGALNELMMFSELSSFTGVKNNVDNEIEILRSRTLTENTVKKLNLDISYFSEGRIKSFEIYKKSPIKVFFREPSDVTEAKGLSFTVDVLSNTKFLIKTEESGVLGEYTFGETITNHLGSFIVTKNEDSFSTEENIKPVIVFVSTVKRVTERYRRSLSVETLSKFTSVISISITDLNKEKAEDFLNTLVTLYNEDAIADRKYISEKTSEFINERLKIISEELGVVENEAEEFKKQYRITDIPTQASLYLQNSSEFEKKIIDTEIKISIINTIIDSFNKKESLSDVIPIDILPSEANASGLISELNKFILHREKISLNAGPDNTVLKDIDSQISALKASLKESLLRTKANLEIGLKDIREQRSFLAGEISKVPTLEKESRVIARQQGIKEALYLYLLQKREETEISMAAIAPNAKVIDAAVAADIPVSPKKNIIYLAALILGLLIPFAIIYIKDLLDTKIKRSDIDKYLATIPFIGDVPRSESEKDIIRASSRTSTAEALRIVRTNLEFILSQVKNGNSQVIFVTSTLPKEGKTFISTNLAGTFALSGKKTLLLGMDIRNPKLGEYLKLPTIGLTNYLSSDSIQLNSILTKIEGFKEFYAMSPGVIPPNPAELLMSNKVSEMFEQLKEQFDYIIVDTAPVSLVTDTLLIAQNADAFVYVVREHYLDRSLLHMPQKLYKDKKLPNMSILLNDTNSKKTYRNQGFGYGYGSYFERETKKSWYKKILNRR